MELPAVMILLAGIVAMDTTSGPQILISEPVVSCSVLGILFGIPESGLMIGILYQLLWLGYMPLGAARLADSNMAAFISTGALFTASRIFEFTDSVMHAAIVPSMLYAVVIAYIGLHLTNNVRKLNGKRNDKCRLKIEKGENLSIAGCHILGIGSSILRGILMALVLIPAGTIIIGLIRFMPSILISSLEYSSLIIWGVVSASALFFFWLKGRQKVLLLGSVGGIIWMLVFVLQKV